MSKRFFLMKLGPEVREFVEVKTPSPRIISDHSPSPTVHDPLKRWRVHVLVLDEQGLREIEVERW